MTYDLRKLLLGIAIVAVAIVTATNLAYGQSPLTISYSPATPTANQPIEFYYSGGGPTDLAIYPTSSCPGLEGFGGSNAIVTLVVPTGQYNVTLAGGLPSGSYSVGTIDWPKRTWRSCL